MFKDKNFPRKAAVEEKRSSHYIDKKEFFDEIVKYKDTGKVNSRLGMMLMSISVHFARHPRFRRYKCIEELISEGILAEIKALKSFNTSKSSNPVAYFTEVVKNAFKAYLAKMYKDDNFQRDMICDAYHKMNMPFVDEIKKDMTESAVERLKRFFEDA